MGKNNKHKQVIQEPEIDEDDEEIQQIDQDQYLGNNLDNQGEDNQINHEKLLQIIKAEAENGQDENRLTWLALYSLKKQQIQLNNKKQDQINSIKDKYQMLKQPIAHNIASVAFGKQIQKSLYTPQGFSPVKDTKIKPKALEDFWTSIFSKSGLIDIDQDLDAIQKLSEFKSEMIDVQKFLSNPEQQGKPQIITKTQIKWKSGVNKQSVFSKLFGTDEQQILGLALEFYADYKNSLFFYLNEDDQQQQENQQEQDEEDDDDQVQPVKPTKKTKKEEKQKQSQKPECKQQ